MIQISVIIFLFGLVVFYRYAIPYLFPSVVHGVSIIKPNDDNDEVYVIEGGKVPFFSNDKRSHIKAIRRRKNNVLNATGV